MDRRNFLQNHLDENLATLRNNEADTGPEQQQHLMTVRAIIKEVVPVLDEYNDALNKRNISTTFTHNDTMFTFLMHYADGGHQGFSIRQDRRFSREYQLMDLYRNEEGKDHTSWDGSSVVGDAWSIREFEEFVQKSIDEYLFYSPRHGGVKELR